MVIMNTNHNVNIILILQHFDYNVLETLKKNILRYYI